MNTPLPSAFAGRLVVAGHPVSSVTARNEQQTQLNRAYTDLANALPHADACAAMGISVDGLATTPDFHPGKPVPVGVVADVRDGILPHMIGNDIGCGMRMLVVRGVKADMLTHDLDRHLRHIFFQGGRDIALTGRNRHALLQHGLPGLLESLAARREGLLARVDLGQAWTDLESVSDNGVFAAAGIDPNFLDYAALDDTFRRDALLGSLGGGNHFCEIGIVDRIEDGGVAMAAGLASGDIVIVVHSGSLDFGQSVGAVTRTALHERIGTVPDHRILHAERDKKLHDRFLLGQANAANAAFANRFFLGLQASEAIRRAVDREITADLVYDAPHNVIWPADENGLARHRKGACSAAGIGETSSKRYQWIGEPVILPGSMGDGSWLLAGSSDAAMLSSAAHGAGRRLSRQEARSAPSSLAGLRVVGPVDFNSQQIKGRQDVIEAAMGRIMEEAPAAYRPIDDVVDVMVDAGMVRRGVRIRPLLTVKG